MATKRILRLTNQEAVVKVDGTLGPVTISLATDLKLPTEDISGSPSVYIVAMQVSGKAGCEFNITRGAESLWDLQANAGTNVNLHDMGGVTDGTLSTNDIVVTSSGAVGQLILKLRKQGGYRTKIRSAETGSDTPV
jgi:hypothetical protein